MKQLSILFLILLTSCSSQKNINKEALVYFGKTACLGKCPVYDIYVYNDGTVDYNGLKNVHKKGNFKTKISAKKLEEIKSEIKKIDFSTVDKKVRDLPNTIIKFNGEKLIVKNRKKIEGLEKLLKEIVYNN